MRSTRETGGGCRYLAAILAALMVTASLPTGAYADNKPAAKPAPAKKVGGKPAKPGAEEEAKRAEARKHYAEAESKFSSGDYAAAYAGYKAANDLLPAPQTLYKMAISQDKLDVPADALAAYNAFLASNPPASMDEKVKDAQQRVAELKKKIPAVVAIKSDPAGSSVTVDGVAQMGTTPMEVKLPAGSHKVRVTSPGFDGADKTVELEPGGTQEVNVTLSKTVAAVAPEVPHETPPVPAPTPAPAAEVASEGHSNVAGYVLLGIAGVGAGVGTIFGVKALQEKSEFNSGSKTNDQADTVEKDALIADMAFGAALTLGVTGVVLLLSGGSSEKAQTATHVAKLQVLPTVTPYAHGGFGAGATLRF